jgi:sugar/nucleoside kinase (ribokinase family)
MQDVITIGAVTRDVFLVSDQFKFVESSVFETGMGECVSLGSKVEIEKVVHSTGGGATNAAVTFARLGFSCSAICKVGNDHVGSGVIVDLQRDGVKTTLIKRADGDTGYSTLLTDAKSGERTVLVYRGISGTLTQSDIAWRDCLASWFYVTSLGGNLALAKRLAAHADFCSTDFAWNPGGKEIALGLRALKPVIARARIFIVNREEAEKLTKKKDLKAMFKKLHVPDAVTIVTDGANGAYAQTDGRRYFAASTGTKAISRTGAGDAFGSGFVAAYLKTPNVPHALAVGTLNAESVIREIGAKAGILSRWPSPSQITRVKIKPA